MVEKLFQAIREKSAQYIRHAKMFGDNNFLVKDELAIIIGMEEAFKIISGHSYTHHLINDIKRDLGGE